MLLVRSSLILALVAVVSALPSSNPQGGANERALQLAKGWLIKERNDDFHWGRSTALALLALSRIPSWNSGSIESWLSIRQMYIDFLLQKIKERFASTGTDILLTRTLASLCRNVTDFYGYDLTEDMLRSGKDDFAFADELLTACGMSTRIIRMKHVRRLEQLLDPETWGQASHKSDTMAMVVMAAECLRHRYHQTSYLLPNIKKLAEEMNSKQGEDGSFGGGNVITTSLSIQAMQTDSDGLGVRSNLDSAVSWLRSQQRADGSFGDVLSTTEAVMALSPLGGRINLDAKCVKRFESDDVLVNEKDVLVREASALKTIHVHVWFQSDVEDVDVVETPVEEANIYQILQQVNAHKELKLKFEFKEFAFGNYLTSINGLREGLSDYWAVHVLPSDKTTILKERSDALKEYQLTTGMESVRPADGDILLLWYKAI